MMIRKTAKSAVAADRPLTANEAAALTGRIRKAVDSAWALLREAQEREAWKALGYASWEAYVKAEFSMSRSRSYQLLDQGRVIAAIAETTGGLSTSVDISEAAAREIKDDLPAVQAEIVTRIEEGEEPAKAATDVIAEARIAKAKAREERKSEQAEFDRQREEHRAALPRPIKDREQANQEWRAKAEAGKLAQQSDDRIAELEEAVRVLEAENEELRAEVAKFGHMRVQFEQGGFEKVIADKDEVVRVLEARLISESATAAQWRKSAKHWQAEAQRLGWSSTVTIDFESGEVVNG